MNKIKKIIITGAPGTGKTSIIKQLNKLGYFCFNEVWKEHYSNPTEEKKSQIDNFSKNLFKKRSQKIEEFSKHLFEKRKEQFKIKSASTIKDLVFYDRSLIDVISYLITFKKKIPLKWLKYIKEKKYYNNVFYCPLWNDIYENNNRRKEKFEETIQIDKDMRKLYKELGYIVKEIPKKPILNRVDFILDNI
tara:strand:- start:137 stop:709 length:573 start_codon:yes stop_codon:yes gene_type:complete